MSFMTYTFMKVLKVLILTVLSNVTLKLTNNSVLSLNTLDPGYTGSPSFIMSCKTDGTLTMESNTRIVANRDTKIILECNSTILIYHQQHILV